MRHSDPFDTRHLVAGHRRSIRRLATGATVIALVVAACGDDADDQEATGQDVTDVTGVTIDTSSTTSGAPASGASGSGTTPTTDEMHGGDASPDRFIYAWHMGMPMRPMAITPAAYGGDGPDAPADDVADVAVYLIGPTDERNPVGPEREIPGPDGGTVVLPPHEQVHDRIVDESDPHDAIGVFVTAGPAATDETVRTRSAPQGSVVGAPLAHEIKMGDVWTTLTNHVAIEWGVEQDLLELVPFEYGGLIWTTFVDDRPFDLQCATATPPPADAAATPDEFAVYGWYANLPIRPTAILPAAYGGPGPDAPSDDVPDVTVYLVGPVDEESPSAPPREGIPTADGPRNLPTHMQVHDRLVPADRPHDAMGVFVVPGPNATDSNVATRAEPDDSAPGAPLVHEIRIGDVWTPLTSHQVIEFGIEAGLLEAVPFEFGGLLWQEFDDPDFWLTCT